MSILLAEQFHDIAPPVDYSLVPAWVIFVATFAGLALLGWLAWTIARKKKGVRPPQLPRDRALAALARVADEIQTTNPYQFSITVSDILRRYVTEQYALPLTRQTSVEFLNSIRGAAGFSEEDKSLLGDFLNRCDLIKFARYDATNEDSRRLLEEATRFVKGGALATA